VSGQALATGFPERTRTRADGERRMALALLTRSVSEGERETTFAGFSRSCIWWMISTERHQALATGTPERTPIRAGG